MIKLYGVAVSPYYNKVKIALLEKDVNFEEVFARPSQDEDVLARSPMGKIPWVEINGHPLAESGTIVEWLEDAYPTAALLPGGPNERALAREIAQMLELYVALPMVPLTAHLLFGRPLSDEERTHALGRAARGIAAVRRLARMGPWLVGEDFSQADVVAASHLPVVAWIERQLGGELLASWPEAGAYLERLGERPSVARTWRERDEAVRQLREMRG